MHGVKCTPCTPATARMYPKGTHTAIQFKTQMARRTGPEGAWIASMFVIPKVLTCLQHSRAISTGLATSVLSSPPPPPVFRVAQMLRHLCANQGAIAPLRMGFDATSRAREQVHDKVTTCRARVRD